MKKHNFLDPEILADYGRFFTEELPIEVKRSFVEAIVKEETYRLRYVDQLNSLINESIRPYRLLETPIDNLFHKRATASESQLIQYLIKIDSHFADYYKQEVSIRMAIGESILRQRLRKAALDLRHARSEELSRISEYRLQTEVFAESASQSNPGSAQQDPDGYDIEESTAPNYANLWRGSRFVGLRWAIAASIMALTVGLTIHYLTSVSEKDFVYEPKSNRADENSRISGLDSSVADSNLILQQYNLSMDSLMEADGLLGQKSLSQEPLGENSIIDDSTWGILQEQQRILLQTENQENQELRKENERAQKLQIQLTGLHFLNKNGRRITGLKSTKYVQVSFEVEGDTVRPIGNVTYYIALKNRQGNVVKPEGSAICCGGKTFYYSTKETEYFDGTKQTITVSIPYEATQGEKLYAEILVGGENQLYKTGEHTAP